MSKEISQTLGDSFESNSEGDPAPPELLDVIQCRARSALRRYVDASTWHAILQLSRWTGFLESFKATWEISKSSEEDTAKQITFTAIFQMILMMVLNKTMRMEVFLMTQFRTILMRGNIDKEIKETLYFIFVCFVDLSVPSICQL